MNYCLIVILSLNIKNNANLKVCGFIILCFACLFDFYVSVSVRLAVLIKGKNLGPEAAALSNHPKEGQTSRIFETG